MWTRLDDTLPHQIRICAVPGGQPRQGALYVSCTCLALTNAGHPSAAIADIRTTCAKRGTLTGAFHAAQAPSTGEATG